MKDKLIVIKPARAGDILITLPIYNYYSKKYDCIYPIWEQYFSYYHSTFPEVNFIPVPSQYNIALKHIELQFMNERTLDLNFGWEENTILTQMWHQSKTTFDQFTYYLAQVPFKEKFNLLISKNDSREKDLEKKLNLDNRKSLVLYSDQASNSKVNLEPILKQYRDDQFQKVKIESLTDNPFDWIGLLERADVLILIDSFFTNLCQLLDIRAVERLRIVRGGPYGKFHYPLLKSGWVTLDSNGNVPEFLLNN